MREGHLLMSIFSGTRRLGPLSSGAILAAILAAALSAAPDLLAATAKCAGREADPDCALYVIARKCINTEAPEYCKICPFPRTGYCPSATSCEKTTEVWAGGQRYVAIRDQTMCACPQVMHGLVMPMGAVTGIEDIDRPQSIWKFAWDVSQNTNIPPDQVALIVSPPDHRSQSQLHVHIIPLDTAKRADLETLPFVETPNLYNVWAQADAVAAPKGLHTYGILVHQNGESFHIHVADVPLVDTYSTLAICAKQQKKD